MVRDLTCFSGPRGAAFATGNERWGIPLIGALHGSIPATAKTVSSKAYETTFLPINDAFWRAPVVIRRCEGYLTARSCASKIQHTATTEPLLAPAKTPTER